MTPAKVRRFRLHRGRRRTLKPPPDPPYPLADWELDMLATYNGEKGRGIVHEDRWRAEMARLQRRHDSWQRECAERHNAWAEQYGTPS